MRSDFFMVARVWILVFQVVTQCSLCIWYQYFRGTYCIHLEGKRGSQYVPKEIGNCQEDCMVLQPRNVKSERQSKIIPVHMYHALKMYCSSGHYRSYH
jgi:hypothetical protein